MVFLHFIVEALLDELDSTVSHSKPSKPVAVRATITDSAMPRTGKRSHLHLLFSLIYLKSFILLSVKTFGLFS